MCDFLCVSVYLFKALFFNKLQNKNDSLYVHIKNMPKTAFYIGGGGLKESAGVYGANRFFRKKEKFLKKKKKLGSV